MNLTEQFINKIVQQPNYIDFPILIIAILSALGIVIVTVSQEEFFIFMKDVHLTHLFRVSNLKKNDGINAINYIFVDY